MLLQIGGLVTGVVAVLVTIFFSVRSERTKEITVRYLNKRPLVGLEGGRRSVPLEITSGGNRIAMPWLLSAQIENTGNQPIEERDIEAPARIVFRRGRIVGSEIVQKSQPALYARAQLDANSVVLEHKLLNPGDWINFDVLFDGEPSAPSLSCRISGVPRPKELVVSQDAVRTYPALFQFPLPVVYLLLTLGSLSGLASIIAAIAVVKVVIDEIRVVRTSRNRLQSPGTFRFEPELVIERLTPSSPRARVLMAAINLAPDLDTLDQPSVVATLVKQRVPAAVLEWLGVTPDSAATMICTELKETLRRDLAMRAFSSLPSGADAAARDAIMQLSVESMRGAEIIERSIAQAEGVTPFRMEQPSPIDKGALVGGLILFAAGVVIILLLGGTWRTLLSI